MQRVLQKRARSTSSLKGLTVLVMHFLLISPVATTFADELVPDRWTVPIVEALSSARSGSQLAKDLDSLSREDRERQIEAEIRAGNVPVHWKKFVPIALKGNIESKEQSLIIFISPDYLSLGSDEDFLRIPLSPRIAQNVADHLECLLPTRRMVDQIYAAAEVVLKPQPMAPTDEMTRLSYFSRHNQKIQKVISELRARYSSKEASIVLSGHSGGGSIIFGYINACSEIPDDVIRIAFLDATFGYETERHRSKLANWLQKPGTSLCVLAYKDDEVTLNGKRIVSAIGGTWYRSRLMRDDLATLFPFTEETKNEIVRVTSADRRIQFLLHTNPVNKILHTVQVEKTV